MSLTNIQKKAIKLLNRSPNPVIWAGAIRSGKTTGGIHALLFRSVTHPPTDYIIAGRTSTTVLRNVVLPMRRLADDFGLKPRLRRGENYMEVGDCCFYYFGANTENAQDVVQGMTAGGFMLDEAALLPKSFIMQCIARCSEENPMMLMTMNKTSPHHWIKKEFIDTGACSLIESRLEDNPHISKDTVAMYESTLQGHYKSRMLDNEWAAATGRIFNDMKESGFPTRYTEEVISVDAAQSGTTAALLFRKVGNHWVVCKEYYYTGEKTLRRHAIDIANMSQEASIVIDPSAASLRLELRELNRYVFNGNNNVEYGIKNTQYAINKQKLWVYPKGCPNLLSEMQGYVWDENASDRGVDQPVKQRDHACDCIRYFCATFLPTHNGIIKKPTYL